ncbi:hypothetical protein HHL23_09210 [Chryseobacterium sp. RP-3-3]|uniref:Lipoprotein n=1 Tax=Chryseobacterium antibioticum TaxID=2728847 RepID=A0A7Y0AMJ0_9FLAO|nr:hypothetical protein [Chryseobacterium antibioticum]NML69977.1 hypothetical protein [Chryseobacterium antibioticum]
MKTKLIILGATVSVLFSCTNDRSEDEAVTATPQAKVIELKKLKTNKDNNGSTAKIGDSTIVIPHKIESNPDGNGISNPTDPGEVVDPTKPDKPW